MEFCERDYTQMRIIPSVTLSLPPSVSLPRSWFERERVGSTLSLPLRISARVWDRCRVYLVNIGRQGRTMDRKLLYIPVPNTFGAFLLSRGESRLR